MADHPQGPIAEGITNVGDKAAVYLPIKPPTVAEMKAMELAARRAITKSRIRFILGKTAGQVFFATLALRLDLCMTWGISTMATDGRRLLFNPAFTMSLSDEHLDGVMMHEVLHCVLKHISRRDYREPEKFNVAADLAINPLIIAAEGKLPPCAIFPAVDGPFKAIPADKCAEEIYPLLTAEMMEVCGPGLGDVMDGFTDQADKERLERDWQVAVAHAAQSCRGRGTLPAGIQRLIDELLEPVVNWRNVLDEFVSRYAKNDYSWYPPNKRYVSQGLYLPTARSEEIGDIVISIDTSGSITKQQLTRFASEVQCILESNPCSVLLLEHDADVARAEFWQQSDGPLLVKGCGGGGTSHIPVFDYIAKHNIAPVCMIALTDMYSEFPEHEPDFPVIWAIAARPKEEIIDIPFGNYVRVDNL